MYTIGIDLGTTNTKAIAVSDTDEVIWECSVPTKIRKVPTGGEMDPKTMVFDLFRLLRKLLARVRDLTDDTLAGIGLTGMAEAGCLADRNGDPLTRILLWYDRRGAEEAEALRAVHEDELTAVSGIRMSNVATVYKLLFLKKHAPELFGHGCRWFGVPEWAAWQLTGEHYTDRTLAVRTGLYSLQTNDWSRAVFELTGLQRELFPEIIPAGKQKIPISPEVAAFLGVPDSVCVTVAGHDDTAAAFGAGPVPGVWVDSTGTAEGLIALTSPCPDPRLTVRSRMSIAPWYEDGQYALIAGVGTSGSLLAALRDDTGLDFDRLDALSRSCAAYPADVLSSELTPQRLAVVNFAPGLTPSQKVSAVYDRILDSFRQRAEQIRNFAGDPQQLIITGGHSLLPELSRRKSDALGGIPTRPRPKPEAAAYGAANLAAASS